MTQPYDYSLNLPDPAQSLIGSLQLAQGIKQIKGQDDAAIAAAKNAAIVQSDLLALSDNPTPQGIIKMMIKHPKLSEQLKRGGDALGEEQRQANISKGTQIYAALDSGKPEIAKELMIESAAAYRNAGDEERAKAMEVMEKITSANPKKAQSSIGLMLASSMGADKFTNTFSGLAAERRAQKLDPSTLTKSQSEAQKAAAAAGFAEEEAALDVVKKGVDIQKLQEDIKVSKANQKIALMNAKKDKIKDDLAKEKLELEISETKRKRDEHINEKTAEGERSLANIDNTISSIDEVLTIDAQVMNDALGPVAQGMKRSLWPQASIDFEDKIKTIQNQVFLTAVEGVKLGAISESEGEALKNSVKSLSMIQSQESLVKNLKEIRRISQKARRSTFKKYESFIPDGSQLSIPDTPNAELQAKEAEALIKKYDPEATTQSGLNPLGIGK